MKISLKSWSRRAAWDGECGRAEFAGAAAGVIHYIWLVKADLRKPLQYAAVLGALLLYRIVMWLRSRTQTAAEQSQTIPQKSRTADYASQRR